MKKLISFLLVTLMLLSCASVVMADDTPVTSIDFITHTLDGSAFILTGNPPKLDDNSYHFSTNTNYQAGFGGSAPTVGGIYRFALGGLSGRTFESQLNGGSLEDYVIEFTVTKKSNGDVIEAIEFGLGAANTAGYTTFTKGTTYREFATIIKTVPFEDFSSKYLDMVSGDSVKLSIPVMDIFNKGTRQDLPGNYVKTYPEFAASTINEFVMQAKCTGGVAWSNVLKIDSLKFVKKTADIALNEDTDAVDFAVSDYSETPSGINGQALVAYYKNVDGNDKLIGCDILQLNASSDNEAAVSIPKDSAKASEATKIKAILFNSINSIAPLTEAVTVYEAE